MYEDINSTTTREETDRKCPACGGVMDFDPATGGLRCPFCEHQEEIKQQESALEQDFEDAEKTGSFDWGAEKKTVTCKSCGAVSVYDALQISDECPYCGSNQVMEEKGAESLAPGGVVTFKVTMQQAGERFKGWIKGKLFCPSKAKKSAKAENAEISPWIPFASRYRFTETPVPLRTEIVWQCTQRPPQPVRPAAAAAVQAVSFCGRAEMPEVSSNAPVNAA